MVQYALVTCYLPRHTDDPTGTLIDKRLCSNIGIVDDFHWRKYEEQRFHPGDIVEVLDFDEVWLAYIPGNKMTGFDIKLYDDFVKYRVGDASDDFYTVLTTESYDSHRHIDSLHVFRPHIKIDSSTLSRFQQMYKKNCEIFTG